MIDALAAEFRILSRVSGEKLIPLAQELDLCRAHLGVFVKPLVEAGLIETVRGRKGGIKLGRPAEDITLLDTIKLTEESFAMAECFEDGDITCPLVDMCDVNAALREALGAFFEVLDSHTIADLAAKKRSIRQRLGLSYIEIEDVLLAQATN